MFFKPLHDDEHNRDDEYILHHQLWKVEGNQTKIQKSVFPSGMSYYKKESYVKIFDYFN